MSGVVVFDFGTSPHGLSAGLRMSHQETRGALSLRLSVDQQAAKRCAVCLLNVCAACSGEDCTQWNAYSPQAEASKLESGGKP